MSINSRIKERREELKMSRQELADAIGVTPSAIANYENEVSIPKVEVLFRLFEALKCDANYIYQDDIKALNEDFMVSLPERNMLKKYRELDSHGAELVNLILNKEYERCSSIKESEPTYGEYSYCIKPSYHANLSAGTGLYVFDDLPAEQIEVPIEYDYIDFVIGVSGNSMWPNYEDGDKVMIVKQSKINVGEVGAFMVNGQAYIKELGTDCLISQNREYPDIIFTEDMRIDCIGKVVGKLN